MVNGSGSINTGEYLWLNTDVTFTNLYAASGQSGVLFNDFPTPGDELLTLYAYGSCLRDETNQVITINSAPSATITPSNTSCGQNNGEITIDAPQDGIGTTYEYSIDGGVNYTVFAAPHTISNLPAGDYDVIIRTTGSGCEDTTTVTVGTSSDIAATVNANQYVCNGATVSLSASGGTTYAWSDGMTAVGSTQTIQVSPAVTTQYSCVVTDASGCSAIVFTTVGVDDGLALTNTFVDPNTCGTTTGSINVQGSGTGQLEWSGPVTDVLASVGLPYNITGLSAGVYTITFTDANGCSQMEVTLTDPNSPTTPTITAGGPLTFCQGQTVDLTSSYVGGNSWNPNGEVTDVITVDQAGTYSVTYTDGSGCSATSAPITVSVTPGPTAPTVTASGPTTFCDGDEVQLTSSYSSGNTWSTGETDQTITVTSSGNITVSYSNGSCSTESAATIVTVNPLPTVSMSPLSQVCVYNPAFALTVGTPAGGTYTGPGVTTNQFDPNTAGTGTHTITYSYTDGNSCSNDATTDIVVDACLGLEEIASGINVYPNPTNDHLIIELDGEFNYTITDARGRVVSEGYANNTTTVDVQSFEYGVYFVNINTNEKASTIRVVKQ
jgi:hypothetical protein